MIIDLLEKLIEVEKQSNQLAIDFIEEQRGALNAIKGDKIVD